jgi:cell division protein FtsW (lipid II flippase)
MTSDFIFKALALATGVTVCAVAIWLFFGSFGRSERN